MIFVRKAWKLLVAIKDGLVLLLMLLFFALLVAALSAKPDAVKVTKGALLLELNGIVVEEPTIADPIELLMAGNDLPGEYALRDVVRAIDSAANNDDASAIVLDLDSFAGAGHAALDQMADALQRAKKAKVPIYAYATFYDDSAYRLAAYADEIWVNDFGGAIFTGPGGTSLYYKGLLDKFEIKAHIYRVGTYKSAVEPFLRSDQSPESKEALRAVLEPLWQHWQEQVKKARPKAQLDQYAQNPTQFISDNQGALAQTALELGLVDKIGTRVEFGKYIATKVGADKGDDLPGSYAHNELGDWLAANPASETGEEIGVITIAGEIVDVNAGPGIASGERIERLLHEGLERDFKALVVRVDSPGGSAFTSEKIRLAIEEYRKKGIPVIVSMGNLAASGGYWVATSSDYIFAEPTTITGSIGIFAMFPSFEDTLARYGINADGVKLTPLAGQPDIIDGISPEFDMVLQSWIEHDYRRFLNLVGKARGKSAEEVDAMAQGRIWDGGTAHQKGLVDRLGSIEDALKEAAKRAELGDDWHPVYLQEEPSGLAALIQNIVAQDARAAIQHSDPIAHMALRREAVMAQIIHDMQALGEARGVQARCIECSALMPAKGASLSQLGKAQTNQSWWRLLFADE